MSNYVILENVADERGESAAKVARTLVRLGCDLYLRFGPSREPYIGENFFPEHPTVEMKYKIDPGDYTLTKESQEVVIKRLGRGDASTLGLFVRIDTKVDSSKTVSYQIELTKKEELDTTEYLKVLTSVFGQFYQPHRREASVLSIPLRCLGRSCLLTQQISCLQTQQMSCLQTQQMSCLRRRPRTRRSFPEAKQVVFDGKQGPMRPWDHDHRSIMITEHRCIMLIAAS